MAVLKTQELNISVWHHDTFGRNSFLGEVDLDLSEWDFNNTQINDYPLKARVKFQPSTCHISLCCSSEMLAQSLDYILNPSGHSIEFNTVSFTLGGQQTADESRPAIRTDHPQ